VISDRHFRFADWATVHGFNAKRRSRIVTRHYLQDRFSAILITCGTYLMRWFGALSIGLQRVGERSPSKFFQFVTVFLSVPFFKLSHFFFKLVYVIQSRRLRFACSEEFFLKFYDRRIATGGVIEVLKSLRNIERGLNEAESFCKWKVSTHDIRS
jgi:hypothetical protein